MDLFKLHNNILGLGGREYLAWLSIWLWISLLAPKLKVDLERKYQETILSNMIWKGMMRAVQHTFRFFNTMLYDIAMTPYQADVIIL